MLRLFWTAGPLLGLTIAAAGCPSSDDPREPREGTLVAEPLIDFPDAFADVGLYPQAPDWDVVPFTAHGYQPIYELWSNGSDKHRFVVLPEGDKVDNRGEVFGYPAGTLFFKTFFYGDLEPVETRILRRTEDEEWDYAVYQWDGNEAELLDNREPVPVDVGDITHTIPAELECRGCHESAFSFVLGWDDVQLAEAYDELSDLELFMDDPPSDPPRIEHPDPATEAVLQDFYGNCVHCHNGSDGPSSSFDLRPEVAIDNVVNVETDSSATAAGVRIVPGDPAASILFLAQSGETEDPEVKQMPPIGVDVRDDEAIERLRTWIEALPQ